MRVAFLCRVLILRCGRSNSFGVGAARCRIVFRQSSVLLSKRSTHRVMRCPKTLRGVQPLLVSGRATCRCAQNMIQPRSDAHKRRAGNHSPAREDRPRSMIFSLQHLPKLLPDRKRPLMHNRHCDARYARCATIAHTMSKTRPGTNPNLCSTQRAAPKITSPTNCHLQPAQRSIDK